MKIGKYIAYTEPGDPFPDETISLNELPSTCPLKYLPYGILSDILIPLIKDKRREYRKIYKDSLVKQIKAPYLKECMLDLHYLSLENPRHALIDLKKQFSRLNTKKNISQLLDEYDIPLVYLEETLTKQKEGNTLQACDWVCHRESSGRCVYGIVKKIERNIVTIFQVNTWSYYDNELHKWIYYPVFHKWARINGKVIKRNYHIALLKKIGQDSWANQHLRTKIVSDYNKSIVTRNKIWEKIKNILVWQDGGSIIRKVRHNKAFRSVLYDMAVDVTDKKMWEDLSFDSKYEIIIPEAYEWSSIYVYNPHMKFKKTWLYRKKDILNMRDILLLNNVLDNL